MAAETLDQIRRWAAETLGIQMVELGPAVMHYVSFNTIAHGMLLDPPFTDMRTNDFQTGGRLANAPGPGAPPQSG